MVFKYLMGFKALFIYFELEGIALMWMELFLLIFFKRKFWRPAEFAYFKIVWSNLFVQIFTVQRTVYDGLLFKETGSYSWWAWYIIIWGKTSRVVYFLEIYCLKKISFSLEVRFITFYYGLFAKLGEITNILGEKYEKTWKNLPVYVPFLPQKQKLIINHIALKNIEI